MLQQLFNPRILLVTAPVFLFSLSLHEFLHAWMADRLGDPTPRAAGRLTLNPLAHYDPIGTTMGLLFRFFGWAKPVPVNAAVFRWPKRDMMLTALGGPASNFALALCCGIGFKLMILLPLDRLGGALPTCELIEKMFAYGIFLNLALGIFNLIPIFPLDGHHILRVFFGFKESIAYDRFQHQTGPFLLMMLIVFGSSSGLLGLVIRTPIRFLMSFAFSQGERMRIQVVLNSLFQ